MSNEKSKLFIALALLVVLMNYTLMYFYKPKVEIKVLNVTTDTIIHQETIVVEKTKFPAYTIRRKLPLIDE